MKRFKFKGILVILYTDAHEFVKDFFDPPQGAILDMDSIPESAGFADIDGKKISIFKRLDCSFEDLFATVAHEMGHLITGGFIDNPTRAKGYNKLHEKKAEHYEKFAVNAYRLAQRIYSENLK
ncbi:MAG: hypothetical protein WCY82_01750 [Desulfotomaculaceae bacterium]